MMISSTYLEALTTSLYLTVFQFQVNVKVTVVTKVGQKTNYIDEQSVDTAHGSKITNIYERESELSVEIHTLRESMVDTLSSLLACGIRDCDDSEWVVVRATASDGYFTSSCTFFRLRAMTEQT